MSERMQAMKTEDSQTEGERFVFEAKRRLTIIKELALMLNQ